MILQSRPDQPPGVMRRVRSRSVFLAPLRKAACSATRSKGAADVQAEDIALLSPLDVQSGEGGSARTPGRLGCTCGELGSWHFISLPAAPTQSSPLSLNPRVISRAYENVGRRMSWSLGLRPSELQVERALSASRMSDDALTRHAS